MPDLSTYKKETPIVAIDAEMVICEDTKSHLARLSIVNYNRHVLFDNYIQPRLPVTNYLTHVTNLDAFKIGRAKKYSDYKEEVEKILKDKIIVGHTLEKDFEVLGFPVHKRYVRDIAIFRFF